MKLIVSSLLLGMSATPCLADKLPAGAQPLTAAEVKAMFSGNTGVYKVADEYYAPDGTTKGIFGKPKPKGVFTGTWSVNGNEICAKNGTPPKTDCNKFWHSGKKVYSLWSVHYDGSKPNGVDDYSAENQIKKGDLVSDRYAKLGGK